jgi:hypothetical protein
MGKPEGKRPLRRPRHRWEDNTKVDLTEVGWAITDQLHLIHDRNKRRTIVNMVMNLQVP